MSYQTALKIVDVIDEIHRKKYLLPSIQREFVWDTYQIERLFDSLMRDYPINAFLFWQVEKEKVKEFQFYEFLRNYHEKDQRHNPKANISGEEEIIAVLDGQQRLTSLYIGLKGTFAEKLPRKRWNNPEAFPTKKLYLNLLKPSDNPELQYDFAFLTDEEVDENDEDHFWFPVSEMLDLKENYQVNEYLINNRLFTDYGEEKANFANKALSTLHSIIHLKETISYFLEKSNKLDKVLNIFIRINSAGTVLSYSDLLLSIATAQWKKRDAREEIISFVDEINQIGEGFNFSKDFVLKSCLILNDFTDIAFKVDNFNKSNMQDIEKEWERITKAIRLAVYLAESFGYNRETLTSHNALIPIAYYLKKIGLPRNFITSTKNIEVKKVIKKWLILSLLKKAFGGQPDNVLRPIRKIIGDSSNGFPLKHITEHFRGTNKSLIFSVEDIESLTFFKYGQNFTFSILSLLYPSFDFRNRFHIDHILPKSFFTRRKLRKKGIPEDQIENYLDYYNYLGNLQLLEEIPNIEKRDIEFEKWFLKTYKTEQERKDYKEKHLIPDVDLSFNNFTEFFEKREKLIIEKLKEILELKIPRIRRRRKIEL
jgi:uncharacterized protein with ParB-like and HNH nuclease domain